ncbi:MAG: circularly permuted type 2 ATP-grasp protein [Acidimicrobiales bacterium]
MDFSRYDTNGFFDELVEEGRPRQGLAGFAAFLERLGVDDLRARQEAAELAIRAMGITFTVYEDGTNIDRSWPFDVLPRIITAQEWASTVAGLEQRLVALNAFIGDIYGDQRIVRDGIFPAELLADSRNFRPECVGVEPPLGVWAHICGSDLVRDADGRFYVLEDNLRVPSGVSYMLENRLVTKRVFPELFRDLDILPVDDYPHRLFDLLASLSPRPGERPTVVVLTPGIYNSAYFEHAFLAQQMGVELAEGSDLVVLEDDCVYLRTIAGLHRVDVVYRRIDDLFLDPEAFNPDSVLGVPGIMRAWRAGNVAIANAPGAGVADDKVVYAYVPDMIRYYLGEEPRIANVPTYVCLDPAQRSHVLANLDDLVVKPANESGGYGIFVGSAATRAEKEACAERVAADPRSFVAQPILRLSTAPTLAGGRLAPRHVDLRPFILTGEQAYVTQGGLTRVALQEGSLVVNSSQGGGSKDTWILDPTV